MTCLCNLWEEFRLKKCTMENTEWLSLEGKNKFMKVVDVYDGDTVTVAFRLNGNNYLHKLRLSGIDSAEMRPKRKNSDGSENKYADAEKEHALKGKRRMEELCLNKTVYVSCDKWDKYGRLMGTIFPKSYSTISINDIMVSENLAYRYDGKGKREFSEWVNMK